MMENMFSLGEWTQIVVGLRDRVAALEQMDQESAPVLADLAASRAALLKAIPALAFALQPKGVK